jgi:hypothetical protein
MVAHICNPNHAEGRDAKDQDLRLVWAKSSQDPISTNKPSIVVCTSYPSYARGIGRRIALQGSPQRKKSRPHLKNKNSKQK